ncbi:MAG: hypothetical protein J6Y33_03125 [Prevotella sp.]|nr:hypothetical protein [Prevotella sp.]
MSKAKVSQDFLLNIIDERGVNVTTLAELMGMSNTMVNGCFRHNKDANGNPRNFPEKTLPKLNAALVAMADEMNKIQIPFGSSQTYTNQRGVTYDPAAVENITNLHRYFKLIKFLNRVLGWTPNKKSIVLHTPSSKGYACVSESEVAKINAAIKEVVIIFNSIEVVPGKPDSNSDK